MHLCANLVLNCYQTKHVNNALTWSKHCSLATHLWNYRTFGASLSEPHTSELNGAFLNLLSVERRSMNVCAHRVQVRTEYRKEHLVKVSSLWYSSLELYLWALLRSFTFVVSGYQFCWTWIPRALLEELSSQCRNKKSPTIRDTLNLFFLKCL